jgi:hypothetical protein
LNGLFAEVMVNAIDLLFADDLLEFGVKFARGFEIMAEGLFDNDARPFSVFFACKAGGRELLNNWREELWSDGKIKELVTECAVLLLGSSDLLLEPLEGFRILEIPLT